MEQKMASEIVRFANSEAVAQAGAELFREKALKAIQAKGAFRVALSGGSTPKRMFAILAEPPFLADIDWAKVHLFWSDERSVPLDHDDSNFKNARSLLIDRVGFVAANIHPMLAQAYLSDGGRDYEISISRDFGLPLDGPPPSFDLIYLGMGSDAHTASLFPGTEALGEIKRWVVRNSVPKLSTTRLTFTYPLINAAQSVCFLVSGADKAESLREVLEGPRDIDKYPSQGVKPAGELLWYCDQPALTKLVEAN
jgi:6-phosphogluconolactonase